MAVLIGAHEMLVKQREDLSVDDVMQSIAALLRLTMKCYPTNLANVDSLLVFCTEALEGFRSRQCVQSALAASYPVNHLTVGWMYPLDQQGRLSSRS